MDNQPANQPPAVVSAPQPEPTPQPQAVPPTYTSASQLNERSIRGKGGGFKKFLLILLILVLLGGAGFLGYTYKKTNDSLKKKSQDLSAAYQTVQKFQAIINQNQAEKDFIAQHNDAELSRSLCSGKPVGMFDVHLNDKFAVFRYLCASSSYPIPIRVSALQKMPDGTYKFTYGASTLLPNGLPDYIFDTDPTFFGTVYGATKY